VSNAALLRWAGLILVIILIALQLKLWVGGGGMAEVESLRAAVKKQTDENAGLQTRNQALAADVEDLKHGEQATEARARQELGLIKPGETFYQVVEPGAAASAPPPPPPVGPGGQ
jgi:cell division protein FtsB